MATENVCLYTKQPFDDAEIKSGDHIFIAAIGGKRKLPKNYVSHEANNYFSKLEKHFSRDSYIALNRQFEGPGKRGSLSPIKATQSNIYVMADKRADGYEKYSLGYIRLGKPFVINQFIFSFDQEKVNILIDPNLLTEMSEQEKAASNFVELMKKSNKYTLVLEDSLPANVALFGVSKNQWFLAVKDESLIMMAEKYISNIRQSREFVINSTKRGSSRVQTQISMQIDLNTVNRVIAKMAFNLLAAEKGIELALESRFDPIRNFILRGDNKEENFVQMIPKDEEQERHLVPALPERAHYMVILQYDLKLVAVVSFYGESFSHVLKLGEVEAGRHIASDPLIFICDWKNGKEYNSSQYYAYICDNNLL